MTLAPLVIKVGGNDLARPGFLPELAQHIAALHAERPCIVVHGGGRAITDLMERLNVQPQFADGQRVTDEAALEAAEMVLSGRINKDVTLSLWQAGVDALGMSGVDRGLIQVEPWSAVMGRVGRVVNVRANVLTDLCVGGVVPVISPISAGLEGRYNVNADHAAGAIAGAVGAARLIFVSNVPGVQIEGEVVPHLSAGETHRLIENGQINGGMIPKVNAALDALAQGVPHATITDLPGLRAGSGTTLCY